jgi:hypothetical protein
VEWCCWVLRHKAAVAAALVGGKGTKGLMLSRRQPSLWLCPCFWPCPHL